jgi:hypothetical protein
LLAFETFLCVTTLVVIDAWLTLECVCEACSFNACLAFLFACWPCAVCWWVHWVHTLSVSAQELWRCTSLTLLCLIAVGTARNLALDALVAFEVASWHARDTLCSNVVLASIDRCLNLSADVLFIQYISRTATLTCLLWTEDFAVWIWDTLAIDVAEAFWTDLLLWTAFLVRIAWQALLLITAWAEVRGTLLTSLLAACLAVNIDLHTCLTSLCSLVHEFVTGAFSVTWWCHFHTFTLHKNFSSFAFCTFSVEARLAMCRTFHATVVLSVMTLRAQLTTKWEAHIGDTTSHLWCNKAVQFCWVTYEWTWILATWSWLVTAAWVQCRLAVTTCFISIALGTVCHITIGDTMSINHLHSLLADPACWCVAFTLLTARWPLYADSHVQICIRQAA